MRAPLGSASVGRPLGPRQSACPGFTEWRLRLDLSAHDVAALLTRRRCSTTAQTIHGWEAGHWQPSEDRLETLARIVGGFLDRDDEVHSLAFQRTYRRVSEWFGLEIPKAQETREHG